MRIHNMFPLALITLIAILGIFFYVVYQNSDSRNLVFSFTAVFAAIIMFYLNMFFELKDETDSYLISTELSIFHDRPEIAQHIYSTSSSGRIHIDLEASRWLAKNNPKSLKDKPLEVMHDLEMYTLVGFLLTNEIDWKKTIKSFSRMSRTSFRTKSEDKGNDTFISIAELMKALKASNNTFSEVPYQTITNGIFLPPDSALLIKDHSLTIDNPFVTVEFEVDDSSSVWYGKPGSNVANAELLPDGSHKYETRYFNINISITYKGQRAKNREMPEYKSWVDNLAFNADRWFSLE